MGLFDELVKKAAAQAGGSPQHSAMATAVVGMLNSQGAQGLQGLTRAFADKGLGDVVSSWIGTGTNLPVEPDQVQAALGDQKLELLAQQAGVPLDVAKTLIASVLPTVVDQLTPGGTVPAQGALGEALGLLGKNFL